MNCRGLIREEAYGCASPSDTAAINARAVHHLPHAQPLAHKRITEVAQATEVRAALTMHLTQSENNDYFKTMFGQNVCANLELYRNQKVLDPTFCRWIVQHAQVQ